MGRRRRNDEIAFGSDSFLDIVANIVGILIILIVVAGVRVSQMPAVVPSVATDQHLQVVDVPPVLSILSPVPEPESEDVTPVMTPLPSPPPPPVPHVLPEPIAPPPEVVDRIGLLTRELEELTQTRESLTQRLRESSAANQTLRQQVESSALAQDAEQRQIENGRRTVTSLQADVETMQRRIAGLHLELAEIEAAQPPAKVLRHKVTPVGKVVAGPELHFLMSQDRVAVVPVDELAEKLKEELMRKKSQLMRGHTRVGTVGPVKGFTMEYVVEREAISLREELQMGTAVIRLGVSEWKMRPQAGAVFESVDEALLPRSRFLNALRAAGSSATLTFWVYPDSFALHRELQDFAHDNGFDVAARPLPVGIPIAGSSTNGSRSIAQ